MTTCDLTLSPDTMMEPVPRTADDSTSDEQLVLAYVRQRDRTALERLLVRHLDRSWRLARHLSGSAAEADEVVQRSWIAVMQHAHRYRPLPSATVESWILGIVVHCDQMRAREERRRFRRHAQAPRPSVSTPVDDPDEGPTVEADAALALLPERYRLPVTLRYLDGMDFRELAQVLGIPERTARTRVARGIQHLRSRLSSRCIRHVVLTSAATSVSPVALVDPHALHRKLNVVCHTYAVPVVGHALVAGYLLGSVLVVSVLLGLGIWLGYPGGPARTKPTTAIPAPPSTTVATAAIARQDAPRPLGVNEDAGDGTLEELLSLPITCALYHVKDLQGLQAILPEGQVLPMYWPVPNGDYVPWAGTTLVFHQTPVRMVIDQACTDLNMRWQACHHCLVMSMAIPPTVQALIAHGLAFPKAMSPIDALLRSKRIRGACQSLALCHSTASLRSLLLMLDDDDLEIAAAARWSLSTWVGTPWQTSRRGTPYLALTADSVIHDHMQRAHEPSRIAGVDHAEGSWWSDPYLIYLHAQFPTPDAIPTLQRLIAAAPDPAAHPVGVDAQRALAEWYAAIMGVASSDRRDPQLERALTMVLNTAHGPQSLTTNVALAYVAARLGDNSGADRIIAAWQACARQHGPNLDQDSDGSAQLLIDASIEAAQRCTHSLEVLAALVNICTGDVAAVDTARRGSAATVLAQLRDPRATQLMLTACTQHPQAPPEAMSVLIGMSLPSQIGPLRAFDQCPLSPDAHVLAHGAELAAGDVEAVSRLGHDFADPQRKHAAILMASQGASDPAVGLLLEWSKLYPHDQTMLQMLGLTRHPAAIAYLRLRLSQGLATDQASSITIISMLAQSGDGEASDQLAALIRNRDPLAPRALVDLCNAQWPILGVVIAALDHAASSPSTTASIHAMEEPAEALQRLLSLSPLVPWRNFVVRDVDNAALDSPWYDQRVIESELMKLVHDDADAEVRRAAISSLTDLNNPLERPEVVRIYQSASQDANEQVRMVARSALDNARSYLKVPTGRLDRLGESYDTHGAESLAAMLDHETGGGPPPPAPSSGF